MQYELPSLFGGEKPVAIPAKKNLPGWPRVDVTVVVQLADSPNNWLKAE